MDSSFSNYFTNVSQPIDIRGQSAGLVEIIVNDCIFDGEGSGSGAYVGVSSGVVTITDSIFKNTYFAALIWKYFSSEISAIVDAVEDESSE